MTLFNELLQIRDEIITVYKRYERFIMPVLRFLMTISVLFIISNSIGYAKPLTKTSVILMMGLIGVFLSPQLSVLFLIVLTSLHAAAGSVEAGLVVFVLLMIIYLLFIRLYPAEGLFIIAMILAYKLHMPYIVPLIAGLFSSLAAIIALVIGIAIWYSAPQFALMMEGQSAEIADMVGIIHTKITSLQEILKNDETLLVSMVILSAVVLIVHVIRKQAIDYAEYIAILVGTVMTLVGFLFAIILFKVDISILGLMVSTIASSAIAVVAQFFAKVADYSRAETVQFEDDENYYFVKVVPKIIVEKSREQIQQNFTKGNMMAKDREI